MSTVVGGRLMGFPSMGAPKSLMLSIVKGLFEVPYLGKLLVMVGFLKSLTGIHSKGDQARFRLISRNKFIEWESYFNEGFHLGHICHVYTRGN